MRCCAVLCCGPNRLEHAVCSCNPSGGHDSPPRTRGEEEPGIFRAPGGLGPAIRTAWVWPASGRPWPGASRMFQAPTASPSRRNHVITLRSSPCRRITSQVSNRPVATGTIPGGAAPFGGRNCLSGRRRPREPRCHVQGAPRDTCDPEPARHAPRV